MTAGCPPQKKACRQWYMYETSSRQFFCSKSHLKHPQSLQPRCLQEHGQPMKLVQVPSRVTPRDALGGRGTWLGQPLFSSKNAVLSFSPSLGRLENLLQTRKVCSIQGAPDPSSPPGIFSWKEAEHRQERAQPLLESYQCGRRSSPLPPALPRSPRLAWRAILSPTCGCLCDFPGKAASLTSAQNSELLEILGGTAPLPTTPVQGMENSNWIPLDPRWSLLQTASKSPKNVSSRAQMDLSLVQTAARTRCCPIWHRSP